MATSWRPCCACYVLAVCGVRRSRGRAVGPRPGTVHAVPAVHAVHAVHACMLHHGCLQHGALASLVGVMQSVSGQVLSLLCNLSMLCYAMLCMLSMQVVGGRLRPCFACAVICMMHRGRPAAGLTLAASHVIHVNCRFYAT